MIAVATCLMPGMISAPAATAQDLFAITLEVDGVRGSASFRSVERLIDTFSTSGLQRIVDRYTETSAARAVVNVRGVQGFGGFDAFSPVLSLRVPAAGIDVEFRGATRDESRRLLEDWLKGGGGEALTRLFRTAVATTPLDPVAGNPGAAMNQFVAADFDRALSGVGGMQGVGLRPAFGLSARFGNFTAAGFDTTTIRVPLGLSWRLSPNDVLELDIPLSWTDTEGAHTYGANIGVLWRRRVTDSWTLQPSARIGGVGSIDLGGGSGIYSFGLTSNYRLDLSTLWHVNVTNAAYYISTFPVSVGGYRIDYNVRNTVFRNGLSASYDTGVRVFNTPLQATAFVVDTRFTGDAVFVRHYQEFGISVETMGDRPLGLSATFLTGDRNVRGFFIGAATRF